MTEISRSIITLDLGTDLIYKTIFDINAENITTVSPQDRKLPWPNITVATKDKHLTKPENIDSTLQY